MEPKAPGMLVSAASLEGVRLEGRKRRSQSGGRDLGVVPGPHAGSVPCAARPQSQTGLLLPESAGALR